LAQHYRTYAYLNISEFDCHHSEITAFLGLEPTEAGTKGEVLSSSPSKRPDIQIKPERPDIQIKYRRSIWKLYSPKPKSEIFIDSHVEAVLELIESKLELIKELTTKYSVGINCVGFYTNANPGFHLSSALIQRVAQLGLWIDFDLYCSCDETANEDEA
jgi:Domain of unknown function (DUF4279)